MKVPFALMAEAASQERKDALDIITTLQRGIGMFCRDVGHGLLEVSHNGLAFVGLVVLAGAAFVLGPQPIRQQAEATVLDWLQTRETQRAVAVEKRDGFVLASVAEPDAIARATAIDPRELSRQQALVAHWIARRYKVAPEPIARLVKEAWIVGERAKLDPTLILGIMAVESSFNPFAQSPVGAQGLMQVMTHIHDDKYEHFGGLRAAFDPVTNLRVGVQVLKECIARAGSVEHGLRYYVGAANLPHDDGYASKVMGEAQNFRLVASGRSLPVTVPQAEVIVPLRSPAPPVEEAAAPAAPQAEPSAPPTAPSPDKIARLG
jgi:Transglycosylase SLT domain